MATDHSSSPSPQAEDFHRLGSPSPPLTVTITVLDSPVRSTEHLSPAGSKIKVTTLTPLAQESAKVGSCKPMRSAKTLKRGPPQAQTASDAFHSWLQEKEATAEAAKRRLKAREDEQRRAQAASHEISTAAVSTWREQIEARMREQEVVRQHMKKIDKIRRSEDARRAADHEALCKAKYKQWLSEKRKTHRALSASQFWKQLSPGLKEVPSVEPATMNRETQSPPIQPHLTLETFGVSIFSLNETSEEDISP